MKLNNKGFAVTGIIYSLLVLFLIVIMLILGILSSRKIVLNKIELKTKEFVNDKIEMTVFDRIPRKTNSPNFNQVSTTNETTDGLYPILDDYGVSYYYRGLVDNNWVIFAGYYWRIIRINGDGTLRIIYQGDTNNNPLTSSDKVRYQATSSRLDNIGVSKFNTSIDDNSYVGYMFGISPSTNYTDAHTNTNNSTIKEYLDTWYEQNIKDSEYASKISDTIFCYDRSVANDANSYYSGYTSNGYGKTKTIYSSPERLSNVGFTSPVNALPTLKCTNQNDKFSIDNSIGNGKLIYPIGLISADEVAISGGVYNESNSFYLKSTTDYYTGTASSYMDSAIVNIVKSTGSIDKISVNSELSIRPVINIKRDVLKNTTGAGTFDNPYKFE